MKLSTTQWTLAATLLAGGGIAILLGGKDALAAVLIATTTAVLIAAIVQASERWHRDLEQRLVRPREHQDRRSRQDAIVIGAVFLCAIVVGLGTIAVVSLGAPSFLSAVGAGTLGALAPLLAGFLTGFLFGLPRAREEDETPAATDRPGRSPSRYRANSNLVEVSDWLTKVLLGAGLTQINALLHYFEQAYLFVGIGTGLPLPAAIAIGASIIVYFLCIGFLGGYLLTRLFLSGAFARADVAMEDEDNPSGDAAAVQQSEMASWVSEPLQGLPAARRLAKRPLSDFTTWRGIATWAKANFQIREEKATGLDLAIKAYETALQAAPKEAVLLYDYATALYFDAQRKKASGASAEKIKPREQQSLEQLAEALRCWSSADGSDLRKNIYKSLTFQWLYVEPRDGFENAIKFGEAYRADNRALPSGGILVNLACAYGQATAWQIIQSRGLPPKTAPRTLAPIFAQILTGQAREPGDAELVPVLNSLREKAIGAIQESLQLDAGWRDRLQLLLLPDHPTKKREPEKFAQEQDLEVFEFDDEIRELLGLPGSPIGESEATTAKAPEASPPEQIKDLNLRKAAADMQRAARRMEAKTPPPPPSSQENS